MSDNAKITVIYLWRYGNPPRFARRFLESIKKFPAGVDYELLYLLKGFPKNCSDRVFSEFRHGLPAPSRTLNIPDDLFSVSSHLTAAETCQTEYVFCLTSWSEILAPNWLSYFYNAYTSTPDCGIVGATGSFETFDKTVPFPNPCIRTTAFFMKRDDLIKANRGPLKTKQDSNLFESGPLSLSKQMLEQGRALVVVDKHGKTYAPENWPGSFTFRSGHQENLLVSDNRTYSYDKGGPKKREKLAALSWGDQAFVPPSPLWRRLWIKLQWTAGFRTRG